MKPEVVETLRLCGLNVSNDVTAQSLWRHWRQKWAEQ